MRVDIEEIAALQARRREINQLPFDQIEWYKDGVLVPIDPKVADSWRFIGLNNIDFYEFGGVFSDADKNINSYTG